MTAENLISLALTLMVFSYLLRDTIVYRLAIYVFVGITSAFVVIAVFENVIVPSFANSGDTILLVIAVLLAALLLLKSVPRLGVLGNLSLAFLIAVGAAVAVTGAVAGTILPLISAVAQPNTSFLNSIVLLVGVVTTLLYFQYTARRRTDDIVTRGRFGSVVATVGEGFIVVMLGATYGAILVSSLSVLTGHLSQLLGNMR